MRRLFPTVLLLSALFGASLPVAGQGLASFAAKAKGIVEAENPNWKLIGKETLIGKDDKEVLYGWGTKESGVTLIIFYGASAQEATERMQFTIKHISAAAGAGPRLEALGDEAYISKGIRTVTVRFRKSNVYVDVSAFSEETARDIAKKLADLVPGK